ncbi:MAG: germination protein YpeB [Clostridiales bacterium GWB2_37_7]|nr:MAG: germination protein YpeB [Clostridiales bacterium GWB2_37_7]
MVVLAAMLILSVFFGYNTWKERKQYQTFLQNTYQREFREMVTDVENIKVLLDKVEVTNSTVQSNALMTQVWRQALSAAENLGQLPISHSALSKTAKYLSQVGDFSYTIAKENAANKMMSEEEFNQIDKLNSYSGKLLSELYDMEKDVSQGKIRFGEMRKKGKLILKRASENAVDVKFGKMDQTYTNYPVLIYDGPFSENVIGGKAKGLDGERINKEKALAVARKFLGADKVGEIKQVSSGSGVIHTYGLQAIPKGGEEDYQINIDVTKTGGHVLWMLNSRDVLEKNLSNEEAAKKAKEFLKKQGFGELVESYYLNEDNTTMMTFIGVTKEGVLLYPDLLKVKVALDNGEVVGFDSYHYLMAPKNRKNLTPKLTEAQAKAKVTQRLEIERVKLAVIPLPGNREALTYEFKGKYKNNDFFVYINAENGNEENILQIIKDENGTLTQ